MGRPSRRGCAVLGVAAAAALGCGAPPARPTAVILVSLDTLRADHLGAYGYPRDTTPALDALAREGVLFERAIAQAASTHPSHLSLFHSQLPSRVDRAAPPLAERLRRRGLRTAAFTGGGNVSAALGFGAGFELYREDRGGLAVSLPAAERWLADHADEPLFLFLHGYDVHAPYDPPPPYDALFSPDYAGSIEGPETLDLLRRVRGLGRYRGSDPPLLSDADRERIRALYDGAIRAADARLARLFAALERLGRWESTLLVVLGDHGEEFWDHGSVMHRHSLHQELVHVPLIWRLPAARWAGRRVAATVSLLDVAPTILELVGAPPAPGFAGASLVPLMEGAPGARDRLALSELWGEGGGAAAIDGGWKLIVSGDGSSRLFDLDADPTERRDLARERPALVAALRARLEAAGADPAARAAPAAPPEAIDPELEARLRELGYAD